MSIIISSKKKDEAVSWTEKVDTKGSTPVEDTLPIARFVVSKILDVTINVELW